MNNNNSTTTEILTMAVGAAFTIGVAYLTSRAKALGEGTQITTHFAKKTKWIPTVKFDTYIQESGYSETKRVF